jgi:predicted CXXCH cytochrome family protein
MKRLKSTASVLLAVAAAFVSGFGARATPPAMAQLTAEPRKAHLDEEFGALRIPSVARGDCRQCHVSHDDLSPSSDNLFTENNNHLCFSPDGIGGCHASEPSGGTAGYPAQAGDRLPPATPWQGYFEANSAGIEAHGVNEQVRWPGQAIWENPSFSAHAYDADMPIEDDMGRGACKNCHNVHEGATPFDLTIDSAGPISAAAGPPSAYRLCLGCHSTAGPSGMNPEGRLIADFYDNSNADASAAAGHAFKTPHGSIQAGSKLPCYDCHNPHGSAGSNGLEPNAFLLSDERPGWYGLTDIRNDAAQVRRFCNGCHPFSDGVGGAPVEGVMLSPLPDNEEAHRSTSFQHCYDRHGSDYGSPQGRNVHSPDRGIEVNNQ